MVKVSIIVPAYNVEKYIEKCLETLVNQTLKEIEIIIVNDGSNDNTKQIAKEYAQNYPEKIKYVEKENGGVSDARNYGIKIATGEYISFLDPDDYAELNLYEKMYNKAIEENSDLVDCNFYWEYPKRLKLDEEKTYTNKQEMLVYTRVMPWNKLIKRSIIEENEINFPIGLRYEDVEFTYKLVPYCNNVSFVKEPLIHYVQRKSSASYKFNEVTKDIFTVLDNVLEYYKTKNLYNEYEQELEYTYTRYLLCSSLGRIVKIRDKKMRQELIFKTWKNLNEKFPNWKKNKLLNKNKSIKNFYMRTVNRVTYKIYCGIFGLIK